MAIREPQGVWRADKVRGIERTGRACTATRGTAGRGSGRHRPREEPRRGRIEGPGEDLPEAFAAARRHFLSDLGGFGESAAGAKLHARRDRSYSSYGSYRSYKPNKTDRTDGTSGTLPPGRWSSPATPEIA